jgi:hypothetical protein
MDLGPNLKTLFNFEIKKTKLSMVAIFKFWMKSHFI